MKPMKKLISLLLAMGIIFSLFSGCQQKTHQPAVPTSITVNSQQVEVPYVMKVDGQEVPLDMYRYYFLSIKKSMDQGDDSYWSQNPDQLETLKENTLSSIKSYFAIYPFAQTNGVSFTEEDSAGVSSQIEQIISSSFNGDKESYLAALDEQFMNEALYHKLAENNLFLQKIFSELMDTNEGKYLVTEDQMKEILSSDYIRASHILLAFDSSNMDEVKEKAEDILQKAQNGEDFDQLVEQYGEDPGMEDNTDGYYFTDGMMVDEFYNAAKSLEENQISGLVETSYGYHIIKRLPLQEEYIDKNIDTLISKYREMQIQKEYDQVAEQLNIEFGPQYDQINTETLL